MDSTAQGNSESRLGHPPVPYANLTNPQTLNLYSMVADDPESFADLDGHTGQGRDAAPSCAANGQGASGAPATGGCNTTQPAQQPKEQKPPDQVDLMMKASAQKVQDARAEQNRTPSEQDKKDALVKAGKMGDAGVKAGLVVVAVEAAVAVAVVAGPVAVQAVPQAGRVIGAAAETHVPGGVATLNQIPDAIRGWRAAGSTTPGTIPQTPGGTPLAIVRGESGWRAEQA